ncbi:MAG: septum formation protein Maf [Bdellovibrionales bacterium]|jgi:septum formation protein|nr:septum formation protein Maf [Bdellovibrionales bacterium]
MNHLILASSSKYRIELLSRLNIPFESKSPEIDEELIKNQIKNPIELVEKLSILKAKKIYKNYPSATIIGSDQIICLDQTIFDKPLSLENAILQLKKLSGNIHSLITAVTIINKKQTVTFHNITLLKMRDLTIQEIEFYVEQDKPLDCAGSYKVESLGISLFDSIDTSDFTSIVGLPLIQLTSNLKSLGFKIP